MKYSILMPFIFRHEQLIQTLESFKMLYSDRTDYEIIIVEDYKNVKNVKEHANLLLAINMYKKDIIIKHLQRPEENIWNPAPHFNQASYSAVGEYIVLTNPECKHTTDILGGFDDVFNQINNAYIVCGCQREDGSWIQNHEPRYNGRWHWCNTIRSEIYRAIGGFDEIYAEGFAAEDNDFRNKIEQVAKLPVILRDDLLVIHLAHPLLYVPDMDAKINRNREILTQRWGSIA
jgi:hypothetical protein